VKADTLSSIMKQLQKRIIRLIESGQITDEIERKRLESLLTSRKWTPYCIRHSAITSDSDYLPEFALKKKVRWCMNSKQPSRYIKTRMGNDLKQKILVQNGIISENNVKSSPTIAECARCQLTNPLENKYCSSCGYPLSVTAYEELKEQENSKYKSVEERLNGMQSILENLVAGLSRTTDQQQLNSVAQSLFSSGALKTTAIDSNNRALQFQQRRRP
jgi:ribosomal protein L37E